MATKLKIEKKGDEIKKNLLANGLTTDAYP
jgi:hypothetical protein